MRPDTLDNFQSFDSFQFLLQITIEGWNLSKCVWERYLKQDFLGLDEAGDDVNKNEKLMKRWKKKPRAGKDSKGNKWDDTFGTEDKKLAAKYGDYRRYLMPYVNAELAWIPLSKKEYLERVTDDDTQLAFTDLQKWDARAEVVKDLEATRRFLEVVYDPDQYEKGGTQWLHPWGYRYKSKTTSFAVAAAPENATEKDWVIENVPKDPANDKGNVNAISMDGSLTTTGIGAHVDVKKFEDAVPRRLDPTTR
ncbi:hypothetical protein HY251_09025 [bacterium]|nr:hypothetical protein [bacterium]